MTAPLRRRELPVGLHPFKLAGGIALGIWLGFLAVALSAWLVYSLLPPAPAQALGNAAARLGAPTAPAVPAETDNPMFEQYKRNLKATEERQAREEADATRARSFNGPRCEFWLQQNRTAPSEKSRAAIEQFCG